MRSGYHGIEMYAGNSHHACGLIGKHVGKEERHVHDAGHGYQGTEYVALAA